MSRILNLWFEIPAPVVVWGFLLLPYAVLIFYPKILCKLHIHSWENVRCRGDFGETYHWYSRCIICGKCHYNTNE